MPTGGDDSRKRIDRLPDRPRPGFVEFAVEDLFRVENVPPPVGLDGSSVAVGGRAMPS